jgi:hypothetical protein
LADMERRVARPWGSWMPSAPGQNKKSTRASPLPTFTGGRVPRVRAAIRRRFHGRSLLGETPGSRVRGQPVQPRTMTEASLAHHPPFISTNGLRDFVDGRAAPSHERKRLARAGPPGGPGRLRIARPFRRPSGGGYYGLFCLLPVGVDYGELVQFSSRLDRVYLSVMAGLGPAIHVDPRDKPEDDDLEAVRPNRIAL